MHQFSISMKGYHDFTISACSITLLSFVVAWYHKNQKITEKKKLAKKILSSPEKSWKKVGSITEIYCYPLKSGKAKVIEECFFGEYGIIVNEGTSLIKDRMFLVYDEKTGKFQTGRNYSKLLLVNLSLISGMQAKLEANGMSPMIFELPKIDDKSLKKFKCFMWFNEIVECIDCGDAVSRWFSKFLTESEIGIRLGIYIPDKHRNVEEGEAWRKYAKVYNTIRNEDTGLFSDLASYMILSESSVNDLNKRLQKPISPRQLRPNIVIEGCEPYAEDDWEWMKIGDEAIVRNIKPCTRCMMTRVDPDTGIPDPQYEPLKTLRTYRKLKDPIRDALESHAPAIGIYCGLYRTGKVRIDDDIFIYTEDNQKSM